MAIPGINNTADINPNVVIGSLVGSFVLVILWAISELRNSGGDLKDFPDTTIPVFSIVTTQESDNDIIGNQDLFYLKTSMFLL